MIIVETQSGAVYEVDPENPHIRRNGPRADTDPDKPDGEWLPISGYTDPVPGRSMVFFFPDGRCRCTTPITRVSTR